MFACDYCGTDAPKACDRCADRFYCSETCQRADWIDHRQTCVEVEDIEGAFKRLRRRTQFASILPEYFVALHRFATVLPGAQTISIQRTKKAVDKALNRLKSGRTVVKGEIRREAYRNAFLELTDFSNFVQRFVQETTKPTIEFSEYFQSLIKVGEKEMIGEPEPFETLLYNVAHAAKVPTKDIKNPSRTWGKNLDAFYDKLK